MERINHFRNWAPQRRREFDPFSMSAGIDADFDDVVRETDYVVERLKERGSL